FDARAARERALGVQPRLLRAAVVAPGVPDRREAQLLAALDAGDPPRRLGRAVAARAQLRLLDRDAPLDPRRVRDARELPAGAPRGLERRRHRRARAGVLRR